MLSSHTIEQAKENGKNAYFVWRASYASCPYKTPDTAHLRGAWQQGWREAYAE